MAGEVDTSALFSLFDAGFSLDNFVAFVEIFLVGHVMAHLVLPTDGVPEKFFSLRFLCTQNFALIFENGF